MNLYLTIILITMEVRYLSIFHVNLRESFGSLLVKFDYFDIYLK